MKIRPAKRHDIDLVKKCAQNAYGIYVERIGKKPLPMIADFAASIAAGCVHILCNKECFAGFIIFYPRGDHLHIENVAVNPNAQGKGYGRQLIQFAEAQALCAGLTAIELYTHEKMIENILYYPTLGYVEIDRHDRDGVPRVFFCKKF